MYEIKPLLPEFAVSACSCMYEIKRITATTNSSNNSQVNLKQEDGSMDVTHIIERQEAALKLLSQLKNQLQSMKTSIPPNIVSAVGTQNLLKDFVVNAHPRLPPYGLLILKKLWAETLPITMKTFSHSTLQELTKEAKDFEIILRNIDNERIDFVSSSSSIQLTLIWKNCSYMEMIYSSANYVPIYNEVNILRYLAKIGPTNFNYDKMDIANDVDSLLDMCYKFECSRDTCEKNEILQLLNEKFKDEKRPAKNCLTIADVALYSAMKRYISNLPASAKGLPRNLNGWFERIKTLIKV